MKQAGIVTFHKSCNYGAVLQAYALMSVVNDLGYDTHVIDYQYVESKRMSFSAFLKKKPSVKQFVHYCLRPFLKSPMGKVRERNFQQFRTIYMNESAAVHTPEELSGLAYDLYISGSDQIWNYHITNHVFDPVFFLQFDTGAKKLIYAASSQNPPYEPDKEQELKVLLDKMDFPVTVREKQLADYVERLTGHTVPQVIDPTLLAGREPLDRIQLPEVNRPPYVLMYQIDANPRTDVSIETLERHFHCDAYSFSGPKNSRDTKRLGVMGPDEFLAMLKNADYIVTNSFHGIALSLLYHKQFFVYENGGVMSRIDSLLESVSLTDRKIKMTADIDVSKTIDYDKVDQGLDTLRQQSLEILKNAIS